MEIYSKQIENQSFQFEQLENLLAEIEADLDKITVENFNKLKSYSFNIRIQRADNRENIAAYCTGGSPQGHENFILNKLQENYKETIQHALSAYKEEPVPIDICVTLRGEKLTL